MASFELGDEECDRFRDLGFFGPVSHPLLAPGAPLVASLIERFRALEPTTALPARPDVYRRRLDEGLRWWRGMQLEIPELWPVARHPVLRDPLRSLIGKDIVWGGAFLATLGPGECHGWHFDSEFQYEPGLVVFLGMQNVNELAAVSMIARSHRIGEQPSAFVTEGRRGDLGGGRLSEEAAVLEAARGRIPGAELVKPAMGPGDFVITDGRMWHGVRNDSREPRVGMVFFFARPSTRFRIVVSGDATPEYYPRDVACTMLEGDSAGAANAIVPPPAGA
jgi:hypothetical protein